jgi:multidrug transporter EmrE-like cation transporter
MKYALVSLTVVCTLFSAYLLNFGAKSSASLGWASALIVLCVIAVNFLKFYIWGAIYRRYELSESYPIVAIFFPAIYILAMLNGEAEFEPQKLFAIVLIIFGVLILGRTKRAME